MSTPDTRTVTGAAGHHASTQTHSGLRAQPGEVYVCLDPAGPAHPVFPALVEDRRWNGWVRPRFRREVAEALLAWLDKHTTPPGAGTTAGTSRATR